MTAHDPLIRMSVLAAAFARGEQAIYLAIRRGEIPRYDTLLSPERSNTRAWKLSTIRAWRPDVAARCQGILQALETHTLTAA